MLAKTAFCCESFKMAEPTHKEREPSRQKLPFFLFANEDNCRKQVDLKN